MALNIIDCLLQLGVVPGMGKNLSKPDNKENQEARAKDAAAQGSGAAPGGGGDGGGGGGGSGGGSGQGSKDDVKNNKDNDKKVCTVCVYVFLKAERSHIHASSSVCPGGRLQPQHPPLGSDHAHKDSQVFGLRLRLWRGTPGSVRRSPQDAGQTLDQIFVFVL